MSNQIVPLTSQPNQSLTVQLIVDAASLTLNLGINYSYMSGYWTLTVYDAQGSLLLSNLPMITGVFPAANILAQYGYLKIGSAYLLNNSSAGTDYPGSTELGSAFYLLWGDTA